MKSRSVFTAALWLLAIVSLLNAVWMLTHAWSWFEWIPGVADTGTANAHFIHDVGIAYAVCGVGLFWTTRNIATARPVYLGITAFFVGHALGHVLEILLGALPHSHWLIDIPLVFAPAAVLLWFALPAQWKKLLSN